MADRLKPDTVMKTYWNRNEEFADLFNAFLYDGRRVIHASELEERDTDSSVILHMDSDLETKQAVRDLFKVVMTTEHAEYVLLGIENQESIHYAMPLRDLEYTVCTYLRQYERIKEKYPKRKGLSGNEFLSHMKKTDRLIPVITVVLYYGDEEWDAAGSLYEMLDLPEDLKPFVSDYRMNLIEVRNAELVFHNKNNKDLFHLLQVIYDNGRNISERKREVLEYAAENEVDKIVLMAFGSTSGIDMEILEREGADVCTFFEEIEREGELIGEVKGEARGIIKMLRRYQKSDADILKELVTEIQMSAEEATEYLDQYNKGIL